MPSGENANRGSRSRLVVATSNEIVEKLKGTQPPATHVIQRRGPAELVTSSPPPLHCTYDVVAKGNHVYTL